MERFLMDGLSSWENKFRRKLLILNGARQTGKTWLLKEFDRNVHAIEVKAEENPREKVRGLSRGLARRSGPSSSAYRVIVSRTG